MPDFSVNLGCNSGMTGGVSWSMPLVSRAVGASGNTSLLISLDAGAALSSGDLIQARISSVDFPGSLSVKITASTQAAAAGLPIGLSVRSSSVTVVPHVIPRLAFGRTKLDAPDLGDTGEETEISDSGMRFMLGGGLAMLFGGSGLGLNVGVQKVFVDGGKVAFGAGLSYAMR